MSVSPARAAAFEIILRVEQEEAYASELLHSSKHAHLTTADHRLATELVMGVLRWRSVLDREIAQRSSAKLSKLDREVLTSLRLAAYQLLFLDRVPDRAAVHESVELVKQARKRSAVPFVNAVLRKLAAAPARLPPTPAKTSARLADSTAHPQWLVERWVREFGIEVTAEVCRYDQQIPPTCIRVRNAEMQDELKNAGLELAPGHLLASARRVVEGDLNRVRVLRETPVIIQDEASQLVALLVGKGSSLLDCCAAPGGKTGSLAEQNPTATILAADLHPHRARLLRELVSAANVQVIAADARELPTTAFFDRVLVDVSCSGTGTLARNPEIKWRLKPDDLLDLLNRQIAILQSAMRRVAPGGRLVYSTCSLEREENQAVVEFALSANSAFRVVACRERLTELQSSGDLVWKDIDSLINGPFLRTIPGLHPCDGFFAAFIEKT